MGIEWQINLAPTAEAQHKVLWVLPDWAARDVGAGLKPRFQMTVAMMKSIAGGCAAAAVPGPTAYMVARIADGQTPSFQALLRWEELLDCDTQLVHDLAVLQRPGFFQGAHHPTLYIWTGPAADVSHLFDVCLYEAPAPPPTHLVDAAKLNLGAASIEDCLVGTLVLSQEPAGHIQPDLALVLGTGCDALQPALDKLAELDCLAEVLAHPDALDGDAVQKLWNSLDQLSRAATRCPPKRTSVLFVGAFAFEDEPAREAWHARLPAAGAAVIVYDAAAWSTLHGRSKPPPKGHVCIDAPTTLMHYIKWFESSHIDGDDD